MDRIAVSLAALLAVAPLLPAGLTYAGLPPFAYVELIVPALGALWLIVRFTWRAAAVQPVPIPLLPWHLTMAVVLGSAIFGLMADNRMGSVVFIYRLRDAAPAMFWPIDHVLDPFYSVRVALTFFEGWLVFLMVADLCRRAPDPLARASTALTGWLAGVAVVAVVAVVQYVTRFQLHPYWVKANPAIVRAHATLDDPNALGAYFALGIGVLVGLLRLGEARRRVVWSGLLAAGGVGLATTMSRAALGAAIVAPLATLAVGPRPETRRQQRLQWTARALVALVIVVVSGSMAFRMSASEQRRTQPGNEVQLVVKTFDPRESTDWVLRGRVAWWKAAAAMFREHPLTGVGLGRFARLMESYGGGRAKENTHNLFLQMLAEAGIAGLAFTGLCLTVCLAFARMVRAPGDPRRRAVALGALIGTMAFTMTLVTGHTLLLPSGQILWASLVAVTAVGAAAPAQGRRSSTWRPARRWLTAAAVSVLALWYPTAAISRGIAPPNEPWGYAWGLYPAEATLDGTGYRWTSGRALLDIAVPGGAAALQIPVAAPSPVRDGVPTTLRVTAQGTTRELTLSTGGVQTIDIPVAEAVARGNGRLLIDVTVSPTFVPARSQPTTDDRILGVQVLTPRFVRDAAR
jgi:O-antigen ligase